MVILQKNKSFKALIFFCVYNLEKNKFKKKGKYREYKKQISEKKGQ